jgi:hypothetical protein
MKQIVCFSGGHSSALAAIETVRKHGKENVILLNHDISSKIEHEDIKRFKVDVANYIGLPITFANAPDYENLTPLSASIQASTFNAGNQGAQICTNRLKTAPFAKYLETEFPNKDCNIIYGFDKAETERIQRRSQIMFAQGYDTVYPLAKWKCTLGRTEDIGIKRPITYRIFKHANCFGCLKAGKRHWYIVYCLRPDIYEEAIEAERLIGYSILKDGFMKDFYGEFKDIKSKGICPSEKGNSAAFWAQVNRTISEQVSNLPCDCAI